MQSYIVRRLLLVIPSLFIITTTIFCLTRLMPGTAVDVRVGKIEALSGGQQVGEEQRQKIAKALGLDVPIVIQYGRWLRGVFQGDFGVSLTKDIPVSEIMFPKILVTFELAFLAMVIALVIAIPVGIYSSIRQDSVGDYIGRTIGISLISLPSFWVGLLIVVLPSLWWNWSPPVEYPSLFQDPIENLAFMWIPAFVVGIFMEGAIMRTLRTMILEVMRQDLSLIHI